MFRKDILFELIKSFHITFVIRPEYYNKKSINYIQDFLGLSFVLLNFYFKK